MKNKTTTRAPCIHKVQAMIYVYVVRRFCLYIFFYVSTKITRRARGRVYILFLYNGHDQEPAS